MRLRHGYTNATDTDGQTVTKRYLGPDADRRHRIESVALSRLAAVLPLPPLLADHRDRIVTGFVPGAHGQELLDNGHTGADLPVDARLRPPLGREHRGGRVVDGSTAADR